MHLIDFLSAVAGWLVTRGPVDRGRLDFASPTRRGGSLNFKVCNMTSVISWLRSPFAERRRQRLGHSNARRKFPRLSLEQFESRDMLATDIAITGFDANGQHPVVHYNVSGENAAPFTIAIYGSVGGMAPTMLGSKQVTSGADLAVGTDHAIELDGPLSSMSGDVTLTAIVDSAYQNMETNESNNQMAFQGGVFRSGNGELNVHGTIADDAVQVTGGTTLNVTFNAGAYTFTPSEITQIRVWGQNGNDTISADSSFTLPFVVFGGDGNDTITGGGGSNSLYGNAGDDTITGGSGPNMIDGGTGNNTIVTGGTGGGTTGGGSTGGGTTGGSNTAPSILNFNAVLDTGIWLFSGQVFDDTNPGGYPVTFGGLLSGYSTSCTVDGWFSFSIEIDFGTGGMVSAQTRDFQLLASELVFEWVSG